MLRIGLAIAIASISGAAHAQSGLAPANRFWAGPPSGPQAFPSFRAFVGADFPATTIPTSALVTPSTTVNGVTCTLGQACSITATVGGVTIGTTTISAGTNLRVLYDNAGVLGEYTSAQLTAFVNLATASLAGTIPAWPNNPTTFFRGDGSYATLNFAAVGGTIGCGQLPALTGDITSSACATTLPNVNTNIGTWGSSTFIPIITVNAKGQVTAASQVAAPTSSAGSLTGTTLASNVVTSSLTSVGTLVGGAASTGFTVQAGNVTWTGTIPHAQIPIATASLLGGVIPDGSTITVDGAGHIAAPGSGGGTVSSCAQYSIGAWTGAGTTTTINCVAPAANAILVTNGTNVPSLGTSLPTGMGINATNMTWTGTVPGANIPAVNLAAAGNGGVTGDLPITQVGNGGNISAANWATNGLRIKMPTSTLTNTAGGAVATAYTDLIAGNTIAASSASAYTNYITTFFSAPTAGSNVTITHPWALGTSGDSWLNGHVVIGGLIPSDWPADGFSVGTTLNAASAVGVSSNSVHTGSFTDNFEIQTAPTSSGTFTNFWNIRIQDIFQSGGAITNQYQLTIDAPTKGTTINQAIYTAGAGRVGIGTSSASTHLHVNDNTTQNIAAPAQTELFVTPADGAGGVLSLMGIGGGFTNPQFIGVKVGGTAASPTAVAGSSVLFQIFADGYNGSGYTPGGRIDFVATAANWSGTNNGGTVDIYAVPNGSTGAVLSARFNGSGGVGIGVLTDPGNGTLQLKTQNFSSLTGCSALTEGTLASVTNSNINTWGGIIGSTTPGTHVLAYCDGTNWTVAGK
jgi:hypothetical protein